MASEWRELFDGRTLDGWKATGNQDAWGVEEGMIKCTPAKGGNLCNGVIWFRNLRLREL